VDLVDPKFPMVSELYKIHGCILKQMSFQQSIEWIEVMMKNMWEVDA